METDIGGLAVARSRSPERSPLPDARRRTIFRLLVAGATSTAVCLGIWSQVPRSLSGQIAVIGYPTFENFNYQPMFWAYRLTVWVFPLLMIAVYLMLRTVGPLRRVSKPAPMVGSMAPEPTAEEPATSWAGAALRVGLVAGVVCIAGAARSGHIRGFAIACGLGYVLVVLACAVSWRRWSDDLRRGIALANGVGGATAALLSLWFVSYSTVVNGQRWAWLPWWLVSASVVGVLYWSFRQLRAGRSAAAVERRLLVAVVGAVALFLAMSVLPSGVAGFQGFDDAQSVTTASLLGRGYFPWRDLLFIHGLFPDALRGTLSMAVFGHTIWGDGAGVSVLVTPLAWVIVYWFAVWVSRANIWFTALVWVIAVSGFVFWLDTRFTFVPLVLAVLGATLRRRSRAWSAGLTVVLLALAILVPETSYLLVSGLAVVVAADLVHREPGVTLWQALVRTRWCAGTGIVAMLLFGGWLWWHDAVGAFVNYYVVFGPGHNDAGAMPMGPIDWVFWYWAGAIAAVLVTIAATAWRMGTRRAWDPRDWVALAAAGFVIFYAEKALGRWDSGHVVQVFYVATPLMLVWLWKLLHAADASVVRRLTPRWRSIQAVTAAALVAALVWFADPLAATAKRVDRQHRVAANLDTSMPRVGYARPKAIDAQLVNDLDVALRAYAGDTEPVFDMTNSLGYVYFLLGRNPATRFVHISMAVPPYAQQLVIDDLERSRPPVVIFDATSNGLPDWDGIANYVRHYKVSAYVLKNWVPVLRTHGNLLLVRRDLLAKAPPTLSVPPQTTDLWFSGATCAWGASANFLRSEPEGEPLRLPVRAIGERALVDITGWAADPATGRPASSVVLVDGDQVVASLTPSLERPDVARSARAASSASGFRFSGLVSPKAELAMYAVADDGSLRPLSGLGRPRATSVRFPDGRVVPTTTAAGGHVDKYQSSVRTVGQVDAPTGVDLGRYDLATLSTGGSAIGTSDVTLSDDVGRLGHDISARSLPDHGSDLALRVGSCPQWHGFNAAKPLFVVQKGGTPVTALTLSGVGD